jgi:pimeloyl-ACP methyl ester carboxylesterase
MARVEESATAREPPWARLRRRLGRGGLAALARLSPGGAAALAERMLLSPERRPRPAAEQELLSRARRLRVPCRYGPLAAWAWGDAGPRVLLVHGWTGRGAELGALVDPLTARGCRVVAFDAPGHGDSGGALSSVVHFAQAVEDAAAAHGPLCAVVAHSLGGPATLWAFRRGPLAPRVAMVAPSALDLPGAVRRFLCARGLGEDVETRLQRRLAERFGVPLEDLRADLLAPRMRAALLVVHDEDDRVVSIASGEALARAWPGASLVRTRGLGHVDVLRDAGVVEAIVRFVGEGLLHGK